MEIICSKAPIVCQLRPRWGRLVDRHAESRTLIPCQWFGNTDFWLINCKQMYFYSSPLNLALCCSGMRWSWTQTLPVSGFRVQQREVQGECEGGIPGNRGHYVWDFDVCLGVLWVVPHLESGLSHQRGKGDYSVRRTQAPSAPCCINPQPFSSSCHTTQCCGQAVPAAEGLRAADQ